jgi:uncharacterized membrane protein
MLLALLVGSMFGIWVGFSPAALSASAYVEQQQNAIRALNALLPAMGLVCIVISIVLAVTSHDDRRGRYLYLASAGLMIIAALVTRFGNQPINKVVMTWSAQAPDANWNKLRIQWWQWHIVRSVAGIAAHALVVLAVFGSWRKSA